MQANEGDFGELFTAISVFCRQGRMDLISKILEKLDPQDVERARALSDGLNYELPAALQKKIIQVLPSCRARDIPIIARLIGYQRLPAGEELLRVLPREKPAELSAVLWSLGRLRYQKMRQLAFGTYLSHQDESVCYSAGLALLRMGEPTILNYCMRSDASQNWSIPLVGLCGNRPAASILLKKCAQGRADPNLLLALGLLGDVSAVERLLPYIADSKLAESSASALNLITGAEIYEEAFIPEEIDEDELFEEEREKMKQGQIPTGSDGKPLGTTITRLSQKPDDWSQWWAKNRAQFKPELRYRNGKPYSPTRLLENLESDKSPRQIRQLAYEELVIRYGADFPFETDMRVSQQKQAIAKYAEWIQANIKRFREGEYYFAGRPLM
jgi:hypothetical protein